MSPKRTTKRPAKTRDELLAAARAGQAAGPDPMAMLNPRTLGVRVGIPILVAWVIAFLIPSWIAKAVVGVLTIAVLGLVVWAYRFATKSRDVASIVRGADSAEGRKEALDKLDADFKKDDTAAVFAKAQLLMQDDPRRALKTLEQVNLDKVLAPLADEARAQRAMIHLLLGETEEARSLVDSIDLSRHKDPKARATMAAIVGEAWARSGVPKKAVDLLETFDPADAAYTELRPQLLRSRAFAYAWASDGKKMKSTLRQLASLDSQYLMGFITKKKNPMGVASRGVHPLLEKEAYEMILRSGAVPRKMEMRRV